MDKKTLAIYISGGVISLFFIVITIVLILNMQNKPVNVCTTNLTNGMAYNLLNGYCGINEKEANKYIANKTSKDACLELLDNKVNVVLASEIDDEIIEWLKLNDVEIEKIEIAKDALVFANNINNPVQDLTSEQIKSIYSGKNTNWILFGGEDNNIIAYSSEDGSEDVYMLEKFMGNNAINKPQYILEDNSINTLVDRLTKYLDIRKKAIIYTTYNNMKNINNDEIRTISIDGVSVSDETIKSDEYNATMKIYAIIRSDEPKNSQTRKFVEYITSKEGQAIIQQSGYVNLLK